MSTLGCKCGYTIRNNKDFLPYKGDILRDQDTDEFFDVASDELALFAAAVAANKRQEWINRHFLPGYPHDVSDDGVISDFLSMLDLKLTSTIYECENCGRLWVQEQPGVNTFVSYSPDSARVNGVLASARHARDKPD